jgi:cell filamentation protein
MGSEEDHARWRERWESLFYPGTRTLVNLLNIRDPEQLKKAEFEISSAIGQQILKAAPAANIEFGLTHMRELHKELFGRIYAWAGEVRDFGLIRPRIDDPLVTRFTVPEGIVPMDEQLKQHTKAILALKDVDFARSPKEHQQAFVNHIALAYQTANQMHPFREGNGRTQRIWLEQLSRAAGWRLNYDKVEPRAWNYAASMSTTGELDGSMSAGMPDKLKQVFGHIAIHQKALYNPYIQGKLGNHGQTARVLEIGELSPLLQSRNYRI